MHIKQISIALVALLFICAIIICFFIYRKKSNSKENTKELKKYDSKHESKKNGQNKKPSKKKHKKHKKTDTETDTEIDTEADTGADTGADTDNSSLVNKKSKQYLYKISKKTPKNKKVKDKKHSQATSNSLLQKKKNKLIKTE